MTGKRIALLAVALFAGARGGAGQEPPGPPPPSSRVEDRGTAVLELLPAIGRIGAQAGLIAGLSRNPYGTGGGVQAAGKGQQIILPSETVLSFTLRSPLTVTLTDKGPDSGRRKLEPPQ